MAPFGFCLFNKAMLLFLFLEAWLKFLQRNVKIQIVSSEI